MGCGARDAPSLPPLLSRRPRPHRVVDRPPRGVAGVVLVVRSMRRAVRLLVYGLPVLGAAGCAWLFNDPTTARAMLRDLWYGFRA